MKLLSKKKCKVQKKNDQTNIKKSTNIKKKKTKRN